MAMDEKIPRRETRPILTVQIVQEIDFLLARQRSKQLARLMGFDPQDETRIATAVSEIARNAFGYAGGGRAEYFVDRDGVPGQEAAQLRVVITDGGAGIANLEAIWSGAYRSHSGMGLGLIGSRRLMDKLDVETGPSGTVVTMVKRLAKGVPAPAPDAQLAGLLAAEPVRQTNALMDQNQELLRLLGELRARETDLQVLNEELGETNRGVLVLYAELEDRARAVQQASEVKARFLSGVTHELRTPLNSIVSLSRLMLSHADGSLNAEQEKQVHFILRSAQNLTEMVNDLLDLARIEAGKTQSNLTSFLVADLFAGLRGMFRPLATNPNVKLIFETPEEPLPLYSDEGKLSQILRNFISNALKFTEQGTVTVSVRPHGGDSQMITFSVTDTGVGIAPEHHELVMQEWGQVQQAMPTRHKGSGLGLPLSRSFAELLGGRLEFTSAAGKGSTFQVTLPALALPVQAAPEREEPAAKVSQRILMADDDEVARYLLRRTLGALTTAVVVDARSGAEALQSVRETRPDLVFLDLMMPGLGGMEVLRHLRQDAATADLPVVIHTSKVLTPQERETIESYDATIVSKRYEASGVGDGKSEQSMQIERALLQVGLLNMHERQAP